MSLMIDEKLLAKANSLKRELKHRTVRPVCYTEIVRDASAFQGLRAAEAGDVSFPIALAPGASITLDFGDHTVGYLHFSIDRSVGAIIDSPVMLRFSFGEFPLEIVTPPESYQGRLGSGWLQHETRSVVFTPASCRLERRYSFRYLKIERMDSAATTAVIGDIYADAVSAVDMSDAPRLNTSDPELTRIYEMSLKTLKECEQDVFEDGPKRDRRLWIGDLRLQALADYHTFGNSDLVRRCIYLFASCRTGDGLVAPCVFPDSPPYVDDWVFLDYSLYFISCLFDYAMYGADMAEIGALYPIARYQADFIERLFDDEGTVHYKESHEGYYFIDWCPGLDKQVAFIAVFIYVLRQLAYLEKMLGIDVFATNELISKYEKLLRGFYSADLGLFVTAGGQISWHTQVWAVLSGILTEEESRALLENTARVSPEYTMHTPYMMHYYIEALCAAGMRDRAMEYIRENWGMMIDFGYDCCPEVFNPLDHFDSPYHAPEINSACHAWSCTPAYWFRLFGL